MVRDLVALGLPGLGNFVGEILVLLGAYQANIGLTVLATVGLVPATVYSLRLIQRVFHGPNQANWHLSDFSTREMVMMGALLLGMVWFGLYPATLVEMIEAMVTG